MNHLSIVIIPQIVKKSIGQKEKFEKFLEGAIMEKVIPLILRGGMIYG
ncbi:hypothetical protein HMPREF9163_02129 [Selenomonas sp. oral taxon 138 str. F0429]|nr:hypothetical protein HMPREF9163_02129 [Selenomonas sp. oral taxon 138 str. F0429]